MNKKQFKMAAAVIRNDATLRCANYDPDSGDACVIGGLSIACRVPKKILMSFEGIGVSWASAVTVRDRLLEVYGLDKAQLMRLQQINDGEKELPLRRKRLIAYLKSIVT